MSQQSQGPKVTSHKSRPGTDGTSRVRRFRSWRLVPIAAALFVATTWALVQPTRRYALHQSAWTQASWWLSPVEHNAIARLPFVRGQLNGLAARPGSMHVWVVGDRGLVLHSPNAGRTWNRVVVDSALLAAPVEPSAKTASRTSPRRRTAPVRIVPVAWHAPAVPQRKAQGARAARTPDLIGLNQGTAEKTLIAAGLRVGSVDSKGGSAYPVVVYQSPAAGTLIRPGTAVSLVLGDPPVKQEPEQKKQQPPDRPKPARPKPRVVEPSRNPPITPHTDNAPAPLAADSAADAANDEAPTQAPAGIPNLYAACFASDSVGWIVGDQGAILETQDGGTTWVKGPAQSAARFTAVGCHAEPEPAAAVVGAERLTVKARGTWTTSRRRAEQLLDVVSTGDDLRVAVGSTSDSAGHVLVSRGQGSGWDASTYDFRGPLRSVAADQELLTVAGGTGVFVSRDRGRTWSPGNCSFAAQDSGAASAGVARVGSGTRTLALAGDGVLWATGDAWNSCRALAVTRATAIATVSAPGEAQWLAIRDGTSVISSDDEGRTWHTLLASRRITSLSFRDPSVGWAGTADGTIARTRDGGVSWTLTSVGAAEPIEFIAFRSPRRGFASTHQHVYSTVDGGSTWAPLDTGAVAPIKPIAWFDTSGAWGVTEANVRVSRANRPFATGFHKTTTGDSGWAPVELPAINALLTMRVPLHTYSFQLDPVSRDTIGWAISPDGLLHSYQGGRWSRDTTNKGLQAVSRLSTLAGVAVDSLGRIVHTADGARTWTAAATVPRRLPGPWYPVSLFLLGATALLAIPKPRDDDEPDHTSVADLLVSDRPLRAGDRDVLDFTRIAGGLTRFLQNSRTEPPLTVAVTGRWGTGKSSLMNMLRRNLQTLGFRTVWFNAWHHQREEALLASLLGHIRVLAVPPIWSLRGIRFRIRLLSARLQRYRFPLVFVLPIAAVVLGYTLHNPAQALTELRDGFWRLVGVVGKEPSAAGSQATFSDAGRIIAAVFGIVGTLLTYFKGFKAFGIDPAVLTQSVQTGGRLKQLGDKTSFRYRFALDFREVTDALSPDRLVIFIDDLDRCRPDQVLELLEAVNFLVESGDCIVVLGMDRERVVGCVAIGFKDVAGMLTDSSQKTALHVASSAAAAIPALAVTPASTPTDDVRKAAERRIQMDYAERYLEKLVNMEIPIPTVDGSGLGRVMTAATEDGTPAAAPPPPPTLRQRVAALRRPALATAVALAVVFAARYGSRKAHEADGAVPPQGTAAAASLSDTGLVATTPNAPDTTGTLAVAPLPVQAPSAGPVAFVGGTPVTVVQWPAALWLLLFGSAVVYLVTPRPPSRIHDSLAFAEALKSWAPVLFLELQTPRAAKKFLNRVRYMAMVQRDDEPARAPIQGLTGWLARWSFARPMLRRVGLLDTPAHPTAKRAQQEIAEEALVGLSVIREVCPAWLSDDQFWKGTLRDYVKRAPASQALSDAILQVGESTPLAIYKAQWEQVSRTVQTT